ncbi:programmed cell death protein 2-like isoform X3 [Erythrolamprus reginae]|uniref:programmed cell death protein 2-like isoform X3 n=1 Tax=Erythrolamprus reginae TaxID=121349 RepID=UPI00396C6D48
MVTAPARVLLGLRDAAVPPGEELPSQCVASKLGGSPDWRLSVPAIHPSCEVCRAGLLHVVQIYCPLEDSQYHRVINVFACATKRCWGNSESWKVLRSQYLQVPKNEMQDYKRKQEQEWTRAATDWCSGADDWGEAPPELCGTSNSFPRETQCAALLQRMSLGGKDTGAFGDVTREEQTKPSGCAQEFQPYYISVVEEEDYLCWEDLGDAQRLLKEYQQREEVDLDRLMSARYSWNGQPLFITHLPEDFQARVPPCKNCKSRRIFEFQLMPALVNMLKTRKNADTSIEFGTAVVYTCEKSCWTAGCSSPLEEFIFVQEDPDQRLFK